MPMSKAELKQLIIDGDAYTHCLIREHPNVACDLIEDLLVQTGQKLKCDFASLEARYPERFEMRRSA